MKLNLTNRILIYFFWVVVLFVKLPDLLTRPNIDCFFIFLLGGILFWGGVTSNNLIRISVGVMAFALIFVSVFSCEPAARYLVSHHPDRNKDFLEGILAMEDSIQIYRPFVVVCSSGLFFMAFFHRPVDQRHWQKDFGNVPEIRMRSLILRVAAGVFVLFGAVTVPILLIYEDGWRKSVIIPVIYVCWKLASYAFKSGVRPDSNGKAPCP